MKYPTIESLFLGFFFVFLIGVATLNGCPPTSNTVQAQEIQIKAVGWEDITHPSGIDFCSRARVPGGWIVHTTGNREAAMTFVPDPDHKWLAPEAEGNK